MFGNTCAVKQPFHARTQQTFVAYSGLLKSVHKIPSSPVLIEKMYGIRNNMSASSMHSGQGVSLLINMKQSPSIIAPSVVNFANYLNTHSCLRQQSVTIIAGVL